MLRDLRQSAVLDLSVTRQNLAGGTAFDASKQKLTAALVGGVTVQPTSGAGIFSNAWNGNGTSTYINVPSATGMPSGSAARTLCAMVYLRSITSFNNSAFITQVPASGQGFTFQTALLSGTTYVFTDGVNVSNNVTITGSQIPTLNAWHFVAFVFDGALGYKYYLDGVLAKSGSFGTAINTNSNDVKLMGRTEPGNTGYLDGMQADSIIFKQALSAGQIYSLSQRLLTGQPSLLGSPLTRPDLRAAIRRRRRAGSAAVAAKIPLPLLARRAA